MHCRLLTIVCLLALFAAACSRGDFSARAAEASAAVSQAQIVAEDAAAAHPAPAKKTLKSSLGPSSPAPTGAIFLFSEREHISKHRKSRPSAYKQG